MGGGPTPSLRFASMRRHNVKKVMVIERLVFPEPWSPAIFASELAHKDSRAYRIAWSGRELAGYLGLMFVAEEAHVTTVATAPAFQGHGVGTRLMLAALELAAGANCRHLSLEVAAGNERAQGLYRRFGLAPVGVRKGYYPLTGEDAIVMWVYDIDRPEYLDRLARIRADARAVVGEQRAGGQLVLAIETSCDETAAAVVRQGTTVVSSVVSSQIDLHAQYGGVVPELASRAHLDLLTPVVAEALQVAGLDPVRPGVAAVAATWGPGLIGSLLVGVSGAKALALAWGVPFVGVNHLEGHLFAPIIETPDLKFPQMVLLVSGGHTLLIEMAGPGEYALVGQTIDDAAGEAYDKVARYLGLGYPGGPAIDRLAPQGDPAAFSFPRAMRGEGYDFSFSGLKTSVVRTVERQPEAATADVAASFQAAVVDVLVDKARRAAGARGARGICLAGGVAANSRLRQRLVEVGEEDGFEVHLPSLAFCTDNAAMIGAAGWWRLGHDGASPLSLGGDPNLMLALDR